MKRITLSLLVTVASILPSHAFFGPGRSYQEGWSFELSIGVGTVEDVGGEVNESINDQVLSGGVSINLDSLGIEDDSQTLSAEAKIYNRWFTFLGHYRESELSANGTANGDIRIGIDSVSLFGRELDFLLIPDGVAYDMSADTTWAGLGLQFTPVTFNAGGRVSFTPWVHVGIQALDASYKVTSEGNLGISVGGFERTAVLGGSYSGNVQAAIPEYGLGGELRIFFQEPHEKGFQLVWDATYRILDFKGALDTLGIDNDDFEDIDFSYASLQSNLLLYWDVSDAVALFAGVGVEQVDMDGVFSESDVAAGLDRNAEVSFTWFTAKFGVKF